MSHFNDESNDNIVVISCQEVPVAKEIWERRFPFNAQQTFTENENIFDMYLWCLYYYLCQVPSKSEDPYE